MIAGGSKRGILEHLLQGNSDSKLAKEAEKIISAGTEYLAAGSSDRIRIAGRLVQAAVKGRIFEQSLPPERSLSSSGEPYPEPV